MFSTHKETSLFVLLMLGVHLCGFEVLLPAKNESCCKDKDECRCATHACQSRKNLESKQYHLKKSEKRKQVEMTFCKIRCGGHDDKPVLKIVKDYTLPFTGITMSHNPNVGYIHSRNQIPETWFIAVKSEPS